MNEEQLAYAMSLIGAPYRWWTGGALDTKSPFWSENLPPPSLETVFQEGLNCAGFINLILRQSNLAVPTTGNPRLDGGTYAYGKYFQAKKKIFDSQQTYPWGSLLIEKYQNKKSQGHVAILLGDKVLHCGALSGVSLDEYREVERFFNFNWIVLPPDWLGSAISP